MTFLDAVEIWEIQHPNKKFMDDIEVSTNQIVNKETLFQYLLNEYECMEIVDNNSCKFHKRVDNFFKIHKWNIDELSKTLEYEYDPLTNNKWNKRRDLTDNKNTEHTKGVTDTKEYSENGSHSITQVHYVSAFNEDESPELIGTDNNGNPIYKFNDTEHDRETEQKSYRLSGNSADNVGEVYEEQVDDILGEDTVYSGNDGVAYQDYIGKQRATVEFNIYKWVSKHFCKELLIQVW